MIVSARFKFWKTASVAYHMTYNRFTFLNVNFFMCKYKINKFSDQEVLLLYSRIKYSYSSSNLSIIKQSLSKYS